MELYQRNFRSVRLPGEKDKETIHRLQPEMLREALSAACPVPSSLPAHLTVLRAPGGKPFLPDYPSFHYNFSDSGEYLVLAASGEHEIGIDLQRITLPAAGVEALSRRFYHKADAAQVLSCEKETQCRLFFRIWTIQEAYLKCLGAGLPYGMHRQCVDFSNHRIGEKHFRELPPPCEDYCLAVCE